MPEISRFFGIVIKMFFDNHNPPHFHAKYGGDLALIDIRTLAMFSGRLLPRVTRKNQGVRGLEIIPNALGHPDRVVIQHEEYLALGEETEEQRWAYEALFDHEVSGSGITALPEGRGKGSLL